MKIHIKQSKRKAKNASLFVCISLIESFSPGVLVPTIKKYYFSALHRVNTDFTVS